MFFFFFFFFDISDELFVCLRDAPFPGTSMRVPCTSCGRGSPMNDIQLLLKVRKFMQKMKLKHFLQIQPCIMINGHKILFQSQASFTPSFSLSLVLWL